MYQTTADQRAAREGFKYVVVRGGKRVCYCTTSSEAKKECGKGGKAYPLTQLRYTAQNPSPRRFTNQTGTRRYDYLSPHGNVHDMPAWKLDFISKEVAKQARKMIANGTIHGGMIPKVETCMQAVEQGVEGAVIMDGRGPHALLIEIFTEHGSGTLITAG